MIKESKKEKILNVIYEKGKVTTKELSVLLEISTESVRRYLESLEGEAKIKRVHGGAVKLNFYSNEEDINQRYLKNEREKIAIAKKASMYINDGDKIIIDEGSTTLQLVRFLEGKKNLTIITSSFPVANGVMNLLNKGDICGELIFLGGTVQSSNRRTVGANTIEILSKYYVDKAFISCEGVSIDYGITAYDSLKAETTKMYLKSAKEKIVLADYSKVALRNYYKIDEVYKVDMIITDEDAPIEWKGILKKWNVKWINAM